MKKQIVAYLQCDARYNSFMLEKIGDTFLINCIIKKIGLIGVDRIVTSVYRCEENIELIKCLENNDNIEVIANTCEDVNERFVNMAINFDAYILRVCGDQICINPNTIRKILDEIIVGEYDFFHEEGNAATMVCDIVDSEIIKKYREDIIKAKRFYIPLIENAEIKRLHKELPTLGHNCRANNILNYKFCKYIFEKSLDVYELQNDLMGRQGFEGSNLYQNGIWTSWFLGGSANEFFYGMDGNINPWWCEAAVNLIKDKIKDRKDLLVFEWGAGNSSMFFSNYCAKVISVEHDRNWYEKMLGTVPANVKLLFCELEYDGDYCRVINEQEEKFDIILIDGRDRNRCAANAINNLKSTGIIIWDNSERNEYKDGIELLKNNGFRSFELSGTIWGCPENKDYTSFFYKDGNFMGF